MMAANQSDSCEPVDDVIDRLVAKGMNGPELYNYARFLIATRVEIDRVEIDRVKARIEAAEAWYREDYDVDPRGEGIDLVYPWDHTGDRDDRQT
jgi:hypothetical protein